MEPTERICINSQPISEELFARCYWKVQDAMDRSSPKRMPRLLQFLLLMAIEAFREEGVDVAIFETHHGGQFDSTNVIKCPAVTTITSIGLDHVRQLGHGPYSKQVENIAWHKAGILKPTAAALTTARNRETLTVLHERAAEIGVQLRVVETGFDLPANLVFLTEADKDNLSLACATANTFLAREGRDHLLSEDIERAFNAQKLLGRFSKCNDGDNIWYFDGAHNQMSMRVVAERFKSVAPTNHQKILVFGQESQERDSKDVLKELAYELRKLDIHFDHVIFTGTQQDSSNLLAFSRVNTGVLNPNFKRIWRDINPSASVVEEPVIEKAINRVKAIEGAHNGMRVLVTGSFKLVGSTLFYLRSEQ